MKEYQIVRMPSNQSGIRYLYENIGIHFFAQPKLTQ